jgi:hypothetical protein
MMVRASGATDAEDTTMHDSSSKNAKAMDREGGDSGSGETDRSKPAKRTG